MTLTPTQRDHLTHFQHIGPAQSAAEAMRGCCPWIRDAAHDPLAIDHKGLFLIPKGKEQIVAHVFTVTRTDPPRSALVAAYIDGVRVWCAYWPDKDVPNLTTRLADPQFLLDDSSHPAGVPA